MTTEVVYKPNSKSTDEFKIIVNNEEVTHLFAMILSQLVMLNGGMATRSTRSGKLGRRTDGKMEVSMTVCWT